MTETRIVITSRAIQSRALPCGALAASLAEAPSHSGEEETDAETLCQKSDVAIGVTQTSSHSDVRGSEKIDPDPHQEGDRQ
jgi:hypothetical protein